MAHADPWTCQICQICMHTTMKHPGCHAKTTCLLPDVRLRRGGHRLWSLRSGRHRLFVTTTTSPLAAFALIISLHWRPGFLLGGCGLRVGLILFQVLRVLRVRRVQGLLGLLLLLLGLVLLPGGVLLAPPEVCRRRIRWLAWPLVTGLPGLLLRLLAPRPRVPAIVLSGYMNAHVNK